MRKSPPPRGPPLGPRHSPTVRCCGGAVSYERGTLVEQRHQDTLRAQARSPVCFVAPPLSLKTLRLQGFIAHKKTHPPRTLQLQPGPDVAQPFLQPEPDVHSLPLVPPTPVARALAPSLLSLSRLSLTLSLSSLSHSLSRSPPPPAQSWSLSGAGGA